MRHALASGLFVLLSMTSVSAQDRTVEKVETVSGGKEIHKLSVVMKSKILIQQDQPAGRVVDVVLSDGGCVEYLVAEHETKYYVLPYQAADVRYVDQVVFVDIAPAQFRQVQFFSQDRWPNVYSTEFRQQVNTVFNVRVDAGSTGRDRTRDTDRSPRGDRNDRDPAKTTDRTDRTDRDSTKSPPDANRPPRGERPGAGNPDRSADSKGDPKPAPKANEPNNPRPEKPEAKGNDRDPAPRTPRTDGPGTPPKPGTAPREKDEDSDRDDKKDKDEKPETPPKPAPKPE